MSASELIQLLAAQAPPGLTRVALHASGEAALRTAIASAATVVTLQHPATPLDGAHQAYSPYCFRCPIGLTYPSCEIACVDSLAQILADNARAAVVIEPAAQVPGGMITAPPGHLRRVRDLCDRHDATLIADERFVGGGTGGFFWAVTRDAVTPDVMVAGDSIAAGIGITLSREPLDASTEASPDAIAAALAHLQRVTEGNFLGEARRKASNLTDALAPLAGHPAVLDVRVRGLLAGLELDRDASTAAAKIPYATAAGPVVIVAPPLDVPDADIEGIPAAIITALR